MSPMILLGFTRMIEFLSKEMGMTLGRADFLGSSTQHSVLVSLTLRCLVNIQERLSRRQLDTCGLQGKVLRRDIMGVIDR